MIVAYSMILEHLARVFRAAMKGSNGEDALFLFLGVLIYSGLVLIGVSIANLFGLFYELFVITPLYISIPVLISLAVISITLIIIFCVFKPSTTTSYLATSHSHPNRHSNEIRHQAHRIEAKFNQSCKIKPKLIAFVAAFQNLSEQSELYKTLDDIIDQQDLACPINLDLIKNPVTIETGILDSYGNPSNQVIEKQFYEKDSVARITLSPITRARILKRIPCAIEYSKRLVHSFEGKIPTTTSRLAIAFTALKNALPHPQQNTQTTGGNLAMSATSRSAA